MTDIKFKLLLALSLSSLLSACTSQVKAPGSLAKVSIASDGYGTSQKDSRNSGPGEKFNYEEDELISKETLAAWRHALAHDKKPADQSDEVWNDVRKKDEEESMVMLKDLEKRYPKVSFVKTMMGQVEQHFGKKELAAEYYEEAMLQNRAEPVLFFKAAEMRRSSGNFPKALLLYRKVLEQQPDFPGAKVGEASCLLHDAKTKSEGRKILEDILAKHPDDKVAAAALADDKSKAAD